jgi:hypothetical protein
LAAFVISWTLFGALAFASAPPRALYSASAMNNVSLIFFLAYLRETYAAPFTRMTAVFMLCCAFVLAVPFAFPYYNLHCQALFRAQLILQANARGAREVFLPAFKTIRGLTENYNISFYDPLKNRDPKAAAKIFHTEAKINTDAAFNLAGTSPVL